MTDIIMCIEHSKITKETLKKKIEQIQKRAEKAVNDKDGVFYGKGKTVDEITFYWFRNWLHPALKHRTPKPNPAMYNMDNKNEREEFLKLFNKHLYENGQQNFNYTMQDILDYIEQ